MLRWQNYTKDHSNTSELDENFHLFLSQNTEGFSCVTPAIFEQKWF